MNIEKPVKVVLINNMGDYLFGGFPDLGSKQIGVAHSVRSARGLATSQGFVLKSKVSGAPVATCRDRGDFFLVIAVSQ